MISITGVKGEHDHTKLRRGDVIKLSQAHRATVTKLPDAMPLVGWLFLPSGKKVLGVAIWYLQGF